MLRAATSWALAAISGVGKVPSHILDFLRGSRISDTHLPQFLMRTPRYTGFLEESGRMRLLFLDSGDWGFGFRGEDGDGGLEENEFELLSVSEFWGS